MNKRLGAAATAIRKETDNKDGKYIVNSIIKERQILEKLFNVYNTLTLHYLYEETAFLNTLSTETDLTKAANEALEPAITEE